MMAESAGSNAVAEIQGLYGPLTISEILLQKIWKRQDFLTSHLATVSGRSIRICNSGAWNRLEGPDFRHAELEIDGRHVVGDIEVHFYQRDWRAHGHNNNPSFKNVVLHVVLFPPSEGEAPARRIDGEVIDTVVLLPLLYDDIEAYASDEWQRGVQDILDRAVPWLALQTSNRIQRLHELGLIRWAQKRRFAMSGLETTDYREALHQATLEVLGYRRNRAQMARLARLVPFRKMAADASCDPHFLFSIITDWKLGGMRPANHPLNRLRQYCSLVHCRPHWQDELVSAASEAPSVPALDLELPVALIRRKYKLNAWVETARTGILGGSFGGSRYRTLWCDAFWPLLSALTGKDFSALWFLGNPGDYPVGISAFLRDIQVLGKGCHACPNGYYQGALQHFLEEGY